MSDGGRQQKPASNARPTAEPQADDFSFVPNRAAPRDRSSPLTDPMRMVRAERHSAAQQIQRSLTAWRQEKTRGQAAHAVPIPESGGAALPGQARANMERALGADLSGVKVHSGPDSAQAASALNARAFTVGQDVHFGAGELAPGTREGDKLLAHELTHTVQGARSGVQRKVDGPEAQQAEGHEVSQPHDPAEKEADAVAGHVTDKLHAAAEAAAGQHGPPAAGEPPPPIAAKLTGVGLKIHRNDKTTSAASAPPAAAAKQNPDFAKDAVAFETALGGKAMSHAVANAAAKTLTDKCRAMVKLIAQKGNEGAEKQAQMEARFNDLLAQMGGNAKLPKNQGIAGAVGDNPAVLEEVFAEGNLRERMTILFNFMRGFSQTLVQADVAERDKFITQLALDGDKIRAKLELMKTNAKMQLVGDPAQKVGTMQAASRADSGNDASSSRQASALPKGAELSKREVAFQDLKAKSDGSPDEAQHEALKWKEGADKWRAKEDSEYAQKLHALKLPFGAGPSGTTDRIMSMAQLLGGVDAYATRLACIGYLLPIRAHSLHEILTAASTYGCAFTDGNTMYHDLRPLAEAELRACGGGKFPDEPKEAPPAAASTAPSAGSAATAAPAPAGSATKPSPIGKGS